MLFVNLKENQYNCFTFSSERDGDGLYITTSQQLIKAIYSTLNSKKYCIIRANINSNYILFTNKHCHFDDGFIFLNYSLKNKFKNQSIKTDIKSFANLKTYLEAVVK